MGRHRFFSALPFNKTCVFSSPSTSVRRPSTSATTVKFPRTIGAIDCTHVKIQSPGGELSEAFRNRKGWFSLNVQTISSANLKVLNVVARWAGSVHDQTIFQNSSVRQEFEQVWYGQYILVGDSGYANTSYLATPYTANNPDIANNQRMQVYQSLIIRTRNVVASIRSTKTSFPRIGLRHAHEH
ncbi:putative nuclease HARBI1 [Eupeodes corollae]|uniref:putative nuclease HARBI1 n=1 Tax=Eupeodes corollae TaxID=290404 RepID=UPI0024928D98|nr:putative nuclease HARBI1 [Eupeodes corollae]